MKYQANSTLHTTCKGKAKKIDGDTFFSSDDVDAADLALFEKLGACTRFDIEGALDASDLGDLNIVEDDAPESKKPKKAPKASK